VYAEADQADRPEHRQRQHGAGGDGQTLAPAPRREDHERQRQACRHLHPDAHRHDGSRGAKAWALARRQQQGGGQQQQDQGVVVRSAGGQLDQHRVQPHECRRPAAGVSERAGRPHDQRHGAEARDDGDRLESPQPPGDAQRRGGVAREREQRPVGGVQERPADEPEHRVGGRFGRHVRIGVQAVQGSHAGEAQIAEDVLGDQRRSQQHDHVRQHDRRRERARRQGPGAGQHQQIARAHDQHERLEAGARDAHAEALQWAGHPARPAADARRDVLRGPRGDAGRQQEHGAQNAEQAERAQRAQCSLGAVRTPRRARARSRRLARVGVGCGTGGLYEPIVTSGEPASVASAR